jgi:hypothetical protein
VIITGLANLFLAYLIFARGAKNMVTYSLGAYAIVSGVWSFSLYLYQIHFLFPSLIWIKIVYFFVFFLVFGLFYFSMVFCRKPWKTTVYLSILYFILSVPFAYLLFFTDLWIKDVVEKPWGPETILGLPVYMSVNILWAVFSMTNVYNLAREYFKTTGIDRERVKYILAGMGFFVLFVETADTVIPLFFGTTRYFLVSPLATIFFVGFTAYAILRYRLMDVKVILTEILVAAFFILLAAQLFFGNFIQPELLIVIDLALFLPIAYLLISASRREIRKAEVLESKVTERTKELSERNQELEKFYQLTIGRESRMAELKTQIKELEEKNK